MLFRSGTQAENLLLNKDLGLFIHHFKFSIIDQITSISGYSEDDNQKRIALSNELAGIDNFVNSLKKAVYLKKKIGNSEIEPE